MRGRQRGQLARHRHGPGLVDYPPLGKTHSTAGGKGNHRAASWPPLIGGRGHPHPVRDTDRRVQNGLAASAPLLLCKLSGVGRPPNARPSFQSTPPSRRPTTGAGIGPRWRRRCNVWRMRWRESKRGRRRSCRCTLGPARKRRDHVGLCVDRFREVSDVSAILLSIASTDRRTYPPRGRWCLRWQRGSAAPLHAEGGRLRS